MNIFTDTHISVATVTNIPAINILLNHAYRGEESKKGWTTESNIIAGESRTNEENILQTMNEPYSIFLKYTDNNNVITGCVNLQKKAEKMYLGMFAVSPALQGAGIGKCILHAAIEYATALECTAIFMTVISVRKELIDWYKRHGYKDTGERAIFTEDTVSGKHLIPLEFITLQKLL